eukprot:CAMPEP_0118637778 /NCGR_PEP_ID=MMETSP0785-20121206/3333_1 /TAXON_ID=91992 /ORGANISM="Bolidomonas pacifica, Strain CCMP 1866" /LENGTH=45 /DNA_ID= /DNA_START= /DNA_END= /DNA_ORIENTATION=
MQLLHHTPPWLQPFQLSTSTVVQWEDASESKEFESDSSEFKSCSA